MHFQKPGKNLKKPERNSKNSKNLEEFQKTWRKFGHPVITTWVNIVQKPKFKLKRNKQNKLKNCRITF